jgi:hypothetical protein
MEWIILIGLGIIGFGVLILTFATASKVAGI